MVAKMIDFGEIKERITLDEVARWLGLTPQRGFIACPFHQEKTPSLKLFENRFHCFGCGTSGDVIDFAAQVLRDSYGGGSPKADGCVLCT
jgi:DNA primase